MVQETWRNDDQHEHDEDGGAVGPDQARIVGQHEHRSARPGEREHAHGQEQPDGRAAGDESGVEGEPEPDEEDRGDRERSHGGRHLVVDRPDDTHDDTGDEGEEAGHGPAEAAEVRDYAAREDAASASAGFGSLAEKLKGALKREK